MIKHIEEWYFKFIDHFIATKNKKDVDLYHQSILLSSAFLFSILFLFFFIILHIVLKNYTEAYILSENAVFFLILYPLYVRSGNNVLFGNLIVAGGFMSFLLIGWFYEGIFDSVIPWFTAVSITSFLLANTKSGYFWTSLAVVTIVLFFLLKMFGIQFSTPDNSINGLYRTGASFFGSSMYLILTIFSYEYLNTKKKKILDQHRLELERLSIVASETDNAIMILDKEGNFEWVNLAFTRKTGLSLEQLITEKGRNIIEANDYSEDIKTSLETVIKHKKSTSFTKEITNENGKHSYSQMTLTPIFDKNNELKNIISIRSDITELIEKENKILQQNEEITQQQEELQATLDEISKKNKLIEQHSKELEMLSIVASKTDNAVVIMDKDGNFEWINDAFTKETGLDLEQLIKKKGGNILEANHHSKKIKTSLDIVINQKQSTSFIKRIINTNGDTFHLQTTLTPILDNQGNLKKIVSIRTDISQLKEKEEQVNFQQQEIKRERDKVLLQKEELQEVYNLIDKSIDYATRIQQSILPETDILKKQFENGFIFFKPKDKVSGDFYWWAIAEEQTIITIADCTGHGVPGAFMSLLGISYLREIVQKEYITHPSVILRKLRKEIIKALKQKGEPGEQKDGMDMALVSIDNKTNILRYSGANNPLYIIKPITLNNDETINIIGKAIMTNDNLGLWEIKPNKMPIGIYERMDDFTTHEIQLQKGDQLYLFSDGFADQFGGPKNKKFKYKSFKRLLLNNADKEMNTQKEILETTLNNWQQDYEQVDDITVFGLLI